MLSPDVVLRLRAWADAGVRVVAVALIFAAGWAVQGWRLGARIAAADAESARVAARLASQDLQRFQQAAMVVHQAASAAQADNTATARELRAIRLEMRNAKPLPPDCRPDAERLRRRNAAIDAYNRAAAGSVSGGAVPDP